jgi:DNA mismatch repair protein MutS2
VIPEPTLRALELPQVLERVAALARTPPGRALMAERRPLRETAALRLALARTAEAICFLDADGDLLAEGLADPEPALLAARREGAVLEAVELRGVARWLEAAEEAQRALAAASPPAAVLAAALAPARGLGSSFRDLLRVITAEGEVLDAASPALAEARRRLAAARAALDRRLERLLQDPAAGRALQDRYVSVRGDRYVVPVRAEMRGEFRGILHGASSTGQTLFMEPLETVELNNDWVAWRERECEEVRRFLAAATARLRARLPQVREAVGALAAADADFAAARWGRAAAAALVETVEEIRIELEGARHPLLEEALRSSGREPVPLDLGLGPEPRLMVVSGPNAGGKTLALKTVGLLCLLHQCALPVPARSARLPVFGSVAIDIGDQQSIAESLSTFSARMRNLAAMAALDEAPVLILLDELGAGTDPLEGGALGIAVLEEFRYRGALVVATTHHDQIRAHALSTPGIASAAMEFDPRRLAPTFRLRPGLPGVSAGLEIAERMGLPRRIIDSARRVLGEAGSRAAALLERLRERLQEAERQIEDLARRRRQVEDERADLERRALDEARRRAAAFEARVSEALAEIRARGREALAGMAQRQKTAASRSFERALARARAGALERHPGEGSQPGGVALPPPALNPGMSVRIVSLRQQGVLEEVSESGEASVLVRGVRVRVPVRDVAPSGAQGPPSRVRWEVASRTAAPDRIELIGRRVEEALELLDKYLDDAVLGGHREVRIIHGSGSGRLRGAIGKFLDSHPHVESHRLEEERPGGRGVTLALLRE